MSFFYLCDAIRLRTAARFRQSNTPQQAFQTFAFPYFRWHSSDRGESEELPQVGLFFDDESCAHHKSRTLA